MGEGKEKNDDKKIQVRGSLKVNQGARENYARVVPASRGRKREGIVVVFLSVWAEGEGSSLWPTGRTNFNFIYNMMMIIKTGNYTLPSPLP